MIGTVVDIEAVDCDGTCGKVLLAVRREGAGWEDILDLRCAGRIGIACAVKDNMESGLGHPGGTDD
jgi:hypothetical protein